MPIFGAMIHKALWAALAVAIVTGCTKSPQSTSAVTDTVSSAVTDTVRAAVTDTVASAVTDTRGFKMNYAETFKLTAANRVLVESYAKMSDPWDNVAPLKVSEITDAETIGKIVGLIGTLPDKGQIMKKMSNETPLLRTTFFYPQDTVYFEYYGETIKTPATSFYAQHPEQEKQLFELLSGKVK